MLSHPDDIKRVRSRDITVSGPRVVQNIPIWSLREGDRTARTGTIAMQSLMLNGYRFYAHEDHSTHRR
jgi:hypothetical protein